MFFFIGSKNNKIYSVIDIKKEKLKMFFFAFKFFGLLNKYIPPKLLLHCNINFISTEALTFSQHAMR